MFHTVVKNGIRSAQLAQRLSIFPRAAGQAAAGNDFAAISRHLRRPMQYNFKLDPNPRYISAWRTGHPSGTVSSATQTSRTLYLLYWVTISRALKQLIAIPNVRSSRQC
jgi:hypothetical protein